MNEKLELFLTKLVPYKRWRRILRNGIRELNRTTVYDRLFGDLNKMFSEENNVKLADNILEVNGIKFKTIQNSYGIAESFGRGDYEFGGLAHCVFVDIGANIGDSSLYAASRENVDFVYAFEPFPNTYKYLEENVRLNERLADKIFLFNYALGKENKAMELYSSDDINASAVNSIAPFFIDEHKISRDKLTQITVKNSSEVLKDIIQKYPDKNIVLKIDVEGGEYDIVESLDKEGVFSQIKAVFIEWHYKGFQDIAAVLEKYGFVWFHERFDRDFGLIRAYRQ